MCHYLLTQSLLTMASSPTSSCYHDRSPSRSRSRSRSRSPNIHRRSYSPTSPSYDDTSRSRSRSRSRSPDTHRPSYAPTSPSHNYTGSSRRLKQMVPQSECKTCPEEVKKPCSKCNFQLCPCKLLKRCCSQCKAIYCVTCYRDLVTSCYHEVKDEEEKMNHHVFCRETCLKKCPEGSIGMHIHVPATTFCLQHFDDSRNMCKECCKWKDLLDKCE